MEVVQISDFSDSLCESIRALILQLHPECLQRGNDEIRALFEKDEMTLLAVLDPEQKERVLGMLTLVTEPLLSDSYGRIEDVVVEAESRGMGIGQALVEAAVARAKALGIHTLALTSNPRREAANRLYRRCGFQLYLTNVYHLDI